QARQSAAQFGTQQLERRLVGSLLIGWCQTLTILVLQAVRLLQQCTGLAPDGGVQQVSADLVIAAYLFASESVSVRAEAAVVRVVARMMLARGRDGLIALP